MSNKSVRDYAKKRNVYLWQIANALGISEPTMTRKMRAELSEQEKSDIISIIDILSNQKKTV